jgi:hypothetical protein
MIISTMKIKYRRRESLYEYIGIQKTTFAYSSVFTFGIKKTMRNIRAAVAQSIKYKMTIVFKKAFYKKIGCGEIGRMSTVAEDYFATFCNTRKKIFVFEFRG